jgi:hypothetical protein
MGFFRGINRAEDEAWAERTIRRLQEQPHLEEPLPRRGLRAFLWVLADNVASALGFGIVLANCMLGSAAVLYAAAGSVDRGFAAACVGASTVIFAALVVCSVWLRNHSIIRPLVSLMGLSAMLVMWTALLWASLDEIKGDDDDRGTPRGAPLFICCQDVSRPQSAG